MAPDIFLSVWSMIGEFWSSNLHPFPLNILVLPVWIQLVSRSTKLVSSTAA